MHVLETIFFNYIGDKYWRFDDAVGRVELDYPRDIAMWRGVPSDIDAAFQYIDGKTYFFKGKHFWQFDDTSMMVVDPYPKRIGTHWMQCPKNLIIRNPFESRTAEDLLRQDASFSSRQRSGKTLICCLMLSMILFFMS